MARSTRSDLTIRLMLGAVGILGISYGVFRVLGNPGTSQPPKLATWLIGAILLHDFVLAPAVLSAGWVLHHTVRPRARRYLQGALVSGALVSAIGLPLIYRRGTGLPGKTLLERDYGASLTLIFGVIAAVVALAYVARVGRDRQSQRGKAANVRPPADQTSGTP